MALGEVMIYAAEKHAGSAAARRHITGRGIGARDFRISYSLARGYNLNSLRDKRARVYHRARRTAKCVVIDGW